MFISTESGAIEIVDRVLIYRSSHYGLWSLPVSTIQKIEEYTDSDDPLIDDYFYRFTTPTKEERTASFYAVGWDHVWPELERVFPGIEHGGLCNSTDDKIRLLWPLQKEGAEVEERSPSP
jgi:hypothetical protein